MLLSICSLVAMAGLAPRGPAVTTVTTTTVAAPPISALSGYPMECDDFFGVDAGCRKYLVQTATSSGTRAVAVFCSNVLYCMLMVCMAFVAIWDTKEVHVVKASSTNIAGGALDNCMVLVIGAPSGTQPQQDDDRAPGASLNEGMCNYAATVSVCAGHVMEEHALYVGLTTKGHTFAAGLRIAIPRGPGANLGHAPCPGEGLLARGRLMMCKAPERVTGAANPWCAQSMVISRTLMQYGAPLRQQPHCSLLSAPPFTPLSCRGAAAYCREGVHVGDRPTP
eukprot:GEMP01027509.1.p1 GENE.GEMP01027509.1~~GEMP01027509.1.p1  ORF type:complete len:280 (+),score=52.28 GEMP01027509.1:92-931(+)